jgi:hypothetical protein
MRFFFVRSTPSRKCLQCVVRATAEMQTQIHDKPIRFGPIAMRTIAGRLRAGCGRVVGAGRRSAPPARSAVLPSEQHAPGSMSPPL